MRASRNLIWIYFCIASTHLAAAGTIVNVKDHGAVGDGVTDDTAALQAAISNLTAGTATTGDVLLFPPGEYMVSSSLTLPDGTRVFGPRSRVGSLASLIGPVFHQSGDVTGLVFMIDVTNGASNGGPAIQNDSGTMSHCFFEHGKYFGRPRAFYGTDVRDCTFQLIEFTAGTPGAGDVDAFYINGRMENVSVNRCIMQGEKRCIRLNVPGFGNSMFLGTTGHFMNDDGLLWIEGGQNITFRGTTSEFNVTDGDEPVVNVENGNDITVQGISLSTATSPPYVVVLNGMRLTLQSVLGWGNHVAQFASLKTSDPNLVLELVDQFGSSVGPYEFTVPATERMYTHAYNRSGNFSKDFALEGPGGDLLLPLQEGTSVPLPVAFELDIPSDPALGVSNSALAASAGADWINATDFGADGSDALDDSVALDNALDAAIAAGTILYIPAGTYRIGTPLLPAYTSVRKAISILGDGMGNTVLLGTNPAKPIIDLTGTNVFTVQLYLQDFTFEGGRDQLFADVSPQDNGDGIKLADTFIKRVEFKNPAKSGIRIQYIDNGNLLKDCVFDGGEYGFNLSSAEGQAMNFTDKTLFLRCTFRNQTINGALLDHMPGRGNFLGHTIFRDCLFENIDEEGLNMGPTWYAWSCLIDNCTFTNCGTAGTTPSAHFFGRGSLVMNSDFVRTSGSKPTSQLMLRGSNPGFLVQNCTFTDTTGDPATSVRLDSDANQATLRQITADGDLSVDPSVSVALQQECSWLGGALNRKLYQWDGSKWISLIGGPAPAGGWDVNFNGGTPGQPPDTAAYTTTDINIAPQSQSSSGSDSVLIESSFGGLSDQLVVLRNVDAGSSGSPDLTFGQNGIVPPENGGTGISILEWDMTIGSTSGTAGKRVFSVRFQDGGTLLFAMVFNGVNGSDKGTVSVDFGSGVDFSPTWALNDPMHFTAELDLINGTYTLTIDNSFHSNAVFADARSDKLAGFDLIIFRDTGGLGGALQTFEVGIDNFFTPGTRSVVRIPKGIELTTQQKEAVAALNKEYGPKMAELTKKQGAILTADQKKIASETRKSLKQSGKKGKEAAKALQDALKMTDEQKKQQADVRKQIVAMNMEIQGKFAKLLTTEQQEAIKKTKGRKGKKSGKPDAGKKPSKNKADAKSTESKDKDPKKT